MIKKCEFCSIEFETSIKRKKYCSSICKNKKSIKNNSVCLICGYCGIAYKARNSEIKDGRKYCSHYCYAFDKIFIENKICEYCGKTYKPKSNKSNQKYCSRICYDNNKKDVSTIFLICEYCGKEYKIFNKRMLNLYRRGSKRKYCSKKCTDCARVGKYIKENSPQWKGGLTSLQDLIRKSSGYIKNRERCFKRDEYKSIILNKNNRSKLIHHHLKSLSTIIRENNINKDNWIKFKNILFDINNVVTLNNDEHKLFHKIYGKITTPEQFYKFKKDFLEGLYNGKVI